MRDLNLRLLPISDERNSLTIRSNVNWFDFTIY